MTLKAVLFDFNGVILNDEPIHQKLIDQILLEENLRPKSGEFQQFCLGRSDRACLKDLLTSRGRVVTEAHLEQLIARKSQFYQQQIRAMEVLPLFPGLKELVLKLRAAQLKLAIASGALRSEVSAVLHRAQLAQYFPVIVAAEDLAVSKPEPDGYLLAIKRLNQKYPTLALKPTAALAIEDTLSGIEAAKRAGVPVVGVANTYPLHMLQRLANWTVDFLDELELDRIQEVYDGRVVPRRS
jgi:HAD superfamily hydrolase (TIGR01509 family)